MVFHANRFFSYLVPKNKTFYPCFRRASANLVQISEALNKLVHTADVHKQYHYIRQISELEETGDTVTHEIFSKLETDFIIPFDREDIYYLAKCIDDVADSICSASTRIHHYKAYQFSGAVQNLSGALLKQTREIELAIHDLESLKSLTKIKHAIVHINSLENTADSIYEEALGQLFQTETDALKILKTREILADIEQATDKCEDVANIIETIVIKLS